MCIQLEKIEAHSGEKLEAREEKNDGMVFSMIQIDMN